MSLHVLSQRGDAIPPHRDSYSQMGITPINSFETLSSHSTLSPRLSQSYLERIRNTDSGATIATTDAVENRRSRDNPIEGQGLVSENCGTEHAPWDEIDSGLASSCNHMSLSSLSTNVEQWRPSSPLSQRSNNIGEQKDYSRVYHNNSKKKRVERFVDKKFKKHSLSKSTPLPTSSSSTVFLDVRSSVSSPGKVSLRDRLHQRLRQRRLRRFGHDYSKDSKEQQGKEHQQESVFSSESCSGVDEKEYYGMVNRNRSIADWIDDDQTCSSNSVTSNSSLLRFTHHVRVRHRLRVTVPPPELFNHVKINVYDLILSEAILKLPWGCNFPIGKCFGYMNSGLHMIGTGAYHVGVEINGIEYAYGANNTPKLSGVFTCAPRRSPGYEYRSTLDFGKRKTVRREWISVPNTKFRKGNENNDSIPNVYREVETFVDGATVIQKMANEYMGNEYDLLRQNCCTFAKDACVRLGVTEEDIPTWFLSMAEAGVVTENAVMTLGENVVTPMKRILSVPDICDNTENIDPQKELTDDGSCENKGFEVIALKRLNNIKTNEDIKTVKIVEALVGGIPSQEDNRRCGEIDCDERKMTDHVMSLRQTLSWTY